MYLGRKLIIVSIFFLICAGTISGVSDLERIYYEFCPEIKKVDSYPDLYMLENNIYIFTKSHDETFKLVMIEQKGNQYLEKYCSSGSGDAYNLTPTFLKTNYKDDPIVIPAECGTEYSWVRVFLLSGNSVEDIGLLNVGVEEIEGQIFSVVPYTKVIRKNDSIVFSFTKDVDYDPGGQDLTITKDKIFYLYENGKLNEIKKD